MDLITSSFANVFRLAVMELNDEREECVNGSGALSQFNYEEKS